MVNLARVDISTLHPTRAFPDIFFEGSVNEAPGSENEAPGTHRTWRLNPTSSSRENPDA
jgi:hypothetical protein